MPRCLQACELQEGSAGALLPCLAFGRTMQPHRTPTNPWKLIQEQTVFDCQYFTTRSDLVSHGGKPVRPYNHFRMKYDGVAVLPIDDNGNTTLIGQHRFVLRRFTWEGVGGGSPRGTPTVQSAQAELKEEAGMQAKHWLKIFEGSVSPGMTDEMSTGYVAWGIETGAPAPDPEETLEHRQVSFADAVGMVLSGEIGNLPSMALILAVDVRRRRRELPEALLTLLAI